MFAQTTPFMELIEFIQNGNEKCWYHLVKDVINRLSELGTKGYYLKQMKQDKLIGHKMYIDKPGEDLPEIRNWKRNQTHE